jgi:hypothetical protein
MSYNGVLLLVSRPAVCFSLMALRSEWPHGGIARLPALLHQPFFIECSEYTNARLCAPPITHSHNADDDAKLTMEGHVFRFTSGFTPG